MEHTGRSPQQIADDSLINALSICDESLNDFVPGLGYIFVGKRRANIKALKDRIERIIVEGDVWREQLCPVTHALHAMR